MSTDDWYRNKFWNSEIASNFDVKLKRARDKSQYLRIQANCLINTHPQISLELLTKYFAQGEHFDFAQAYVDQANAFIALRKNKKAIEAFESALIRENEYPRLLTNAYVDLPFFIATKDIKEKYHDALKLLDEHQHRLKFPIDRYKWNVAKSIILSSTHHATEARKFAQAAIEAAGQKRSGFNHHPKVGLFSSNETNKQIYKQIKRLATQTT